MNHIEAFTGRAAVAAFVLAALILPSPAEASEKYDRMTVAELAKAAEAEGKVVVYSVTSRIFRVKDAFEKAYPKIQLIPHDISSTRQVARIKAEQKARIYEADVAYIGEAPIIVNELVRPGHLKRYIPPGIATERVPPEYQRPLLARRLLTKVLMYNQEAHPHGPPVKNLWELTLPAWRSKVVMADPLQRGDYLDLMTEFVIRSDEMAKAYEALHGRPIKLQPGIKSAGEQFIAALYANDVVLLRSSDEVTDAVGKKGQASPPVGFNTYSKIRDNKRQGLALQIANDVAPSPGIMYPTYLAVLNNAPHPAAARLFIHFMMGDDSPRGGPAIAPFYVPGEYFTRPVESHPDSVPREKFRAWLIDAGKSAALRRQVADFILSLK